VYSVDLNCDLGESFGVYQLGNDEEILDIVSSANIACGFHAGDPSIMRKTVWLALEKKAAIGAHPGLPDRMGFGRREMKVTPAEVYDMVVYQVGALAGFVKAEGGVMQHVKPHGALYNMAAKDAKIAEAIAEAVYDMDPKLILYGLAGSELIRAGVRLGLRTASEVFADRTYQEDGTLTSRRKPDALIKDPQQAAAQVIHMVKEGKVRSQQGKEISLVAETICIHGDGAKALETARKIREQLLQAGITIQSVSKSS
jgi:5-oxoprolinase (ATP-hydrolysing) subunit A